MRDFVLAAGLLALRKAADVYYAITCAYAFAADRREWRNAIRSLGSIADRPSPREIASPVFHHQAIKLQRARAASPTVRVLRAIFEYVSPPDKIVWIQPDDIDCKIWPDQNLYCNDILPGDWDRRTRPLDHTVKYRSTVQHFRDGVAWRDTELFAKDYHDRLNAGDVVKGTRDMAALLRHYDTRVDALYDDIKDQGFRVSFNEHGVMDIPHIHIGRDGDMLFGNNGNHRLAIAKLLGVERIPCHVRARHLEWQRIRDRIATDGPGPFAKHPDLCDLLGTTGEPPGDVDLLGAAERIPATGRRDIHRVLRMLASDVPARTTVVDVGSWLGASAAQLALGLGGGAATRGVQLRCYDRWRATPRDVLLAGGRGVQLAIDEDLLPRVRRTLAPFEASVTFHQGDLANEHWSGAPISLYVDDTAATPELFPRALSTFGPSWVPGETVIVLMDARAWKRTGERSTFRQQVFESHGDCFESIASTGGAGAVFRYTAPLDFDLVATEGDIWTLTERIQACDTTIRNMERSTSWRMTAPLRRCGETLRWMLRMNR